MFLAPALPLVERAPGFQTSSAGPAAIAVKAAGAVRIISTASGGVSSEEDDEKNGPHYIRDRPTAVTTYICSAVPQHARAAGIAIRTNEFSRCRNYQGR